MLTLPPEELLPVLVADLADEEAREVLDAGASSGRQIWVPLESAPVSASVHVLEVHIPRCPPIFYVAEPLGPPTEKGFPLRLKPMPDAEQPSRPASGRRAPTPGRDVVRARQSQASMSLSESHTKDLSYMGPLPTEDDRDAKIGLALAGGKLVMEQLIGRGGVGVVYKARHRELMMPVAVKVLHESFQNDLDFARRFYAEALAASRLDHPNITRVIDFGQESDGQLYFAMEFLDGVELRTVLDKEKKLSAARIASLMMQVCAGLSHAHARGVVHRDIKPENLVLVPSHDDDGEPTELVKVCDFGIAVHRTIPEAQADDVIAGTPEYMSPEQCRGDELDARSDIYSCGVVLYELATGQLPFTAEQPAQLLNKHQFKAPTPPSTITPTVHPRLEAIILQALAKEPGERQPSMRELRAQLRELLEPGVADAPQPSTRHASPPGETARQAPRKPLPTLPDEGGADEALPTSSRKAPVADTPDWLERGPVYGRAGVAANGAAPASQATAPTTADTETLSASVLRWTAQMAQTTDGAAFAQMAQKLEAALRVLASRGDVHALWTVSSTMHGIEIEGAGAVGSRAWSAAKLLKLFNDPTILVQIAEQLLAGPSESREKARRLLVQMGVAGAYGVYGARVKLAQSPAVRAPFIAMLKDFGRKAWPVARASLEKISETQTPNPETLDLAEDLLLCVPAVGDEAAGHVVLKFLRSTHSPVCRAATASIVKLWADRAKPVLVAMVQSKDDVVRVAGIAGLRQLGAIDEHLVPRLHAILAGRVPAGEEVRAAAAIALAHARPTAKPAAISLLAQLLAPPQTAAAPEPRSASATLSKTLSKEDAVVIALARSLLTLGGASYYGLVSDRAKSSPEPLGGQLRALLSAKPGLTPSTPKR